MTPPTAQEIESLLAKVSEHTLVYCKFYDARGREISERLIRFGDCARIAQVIAGCRSWQPFIAMHRAVNTIIN